MRPVRYVDVFHGDADGLCAVHQLRLARPVPPGSPHQIVTGLKDDVELLARVRGAPGCIVTALDVSLDRNRAALLRVLDEGAEVQHRPPLRRCGAETSATAGAHRHGRRRVREHLVDALVGGAHRAWAVVGAFGDNLESAAAALAAAGARRGADRHAAPARRGPQLQRVRRQSRRCAACARRAVSGHAGTRRPPGLRSDRPRRTPDRTAQVRPRRSLTLAPLRFDADRAVYRLPAQPWSGRVIGTFANALARTHPRRGHAVSRHGPMAAFVSASARR